MLFKPLLGDQLSGSIGGVTASHNRGGTYFRQRATPTNPNSVQQQAVRGFFSQLAGLWVDTLTQVQRDGWDTYALMVELPNRIGDPRNVGGLGMYQRSNVPRLQFTLPRVDDAPTIFDLGNYTPPTFGILSEAAQTIDLSFDVLDAWVNEDDAALLIYTSRAVNASINYFKGPYRLVNAILGDLALPPTSPFTTNLAFPYVEGQKVFFRVDVTRVDGRYGSEFRSEQLATA